MDLKRILTSVLGIPAIICLFLLGNKYVIGFAAVITSIFSMYEYFNVIKKVAKPIEWVGYLSNIFIIFATIFNFDIVSKIIMFSIPVLMLLLFMQVIVTDMKYTFKDVSYTFLGILYIPFFIMFLELIRNLENGKILIGYVFVVAWSTDIFAYLIGKKWGKHKFSKVSPKKSIEGCVAGAVGAVVMTLLYTHIGNIFLNLNISYMIIAIVSIGLSLVSQIGDFIASSIKRFVDTKDYGNLLPGHGGMLDRIDSLLFLSPFVYLFFSFM